MEPKARLSYIRMLEAAKRVYEALPRVRPPDLWLKLLVRPYFYFQDLPYSLRAGLIPGPGDLLLTL